MLRSLFITIRTADLAVWQLAAAQTLVWAGLYYLFPALMLHWERGEAWSKGDLSLAFSIALVVSALGAPLAGWLIDRGHGRRVLTASAILGGLAIAALALVETLPAFFAVWSVVGIAMAGCLYEPCFAFITHTRPWGAKRAITLVTLAAGFAGTLAFPVANSVATTFSWRASALLFAALIIFVAAPLFWFGANAARGRRATSPAKTSKSGGAPLHRPVFWLLAFAFSMTALSHGMLISHLLPILDERAVDPGLAVLTASLIGPMQVVGRVLMMTFDHRVSVFIVSGISFVFMIAAATILFFAGAVAAALMAFAMLQGSGYGVTSITKPIVTVKVMGRANFGAISGALAVPYMMAYALAPSLAALTWNVGGYDLVLGLAIIFPVLGGSAFAVVARRKYL